MTLFATPDGGATANVITLFFLAGLVVFSASASCVITGTRCLFRDSQRRRGVGWGLLLAGLIMPASCCIAPSLLFRVIHGSAPIGGLPYQALVREGMTTEEVTAALGAPHERFTEEGGAVWLYYTELLSGPYFLVRFGKDGRVRSTETCHS
jgi:hypothetical protein